MTENEEILELKRLLQRNLEATEETRRTLKKHIKVVRYFTILKYLLITGVLAFAIIEVLPFLKPLVELIQLLMGETA